MSDILKKQLVYRLQTTEKEMGLRNKTPSAEKIKLVPKLDLLQTRSVSNMKKKERLGPVSPFFGKKFDGGLTERTVEDLYTPKQPEKSSTFKRKVPIKLGSKLKPIHIHGDQDFSNTNSNSLSQFIVKIKEHPELHDDF